MKKYVVSSSVFLCFISRLIPKQYLRDCFLYPFDLFDSDGLIVRNFPNDSILIILSPIDFIDIIYDFGGASIYTYRKGEGFFESYNHDDYTFQKKSLFFLFSFLVFVFFGNGRDV